MQKPEPTNILTDVPIEHVFYSRTDTRGVIEAANWVFQRISGYEWDTLIGAPHKLVRHPDMPSGVFWMMWKAIQDGDHMSAYVKNLTANGDHYWVLANASPIDGGYVSVRLKPTTEMLEQIEGVYARARKAELDDGATPEESAALIVEMIKDLGYLDYDEFTGSAFGNEVLSRTRTRGRVDDIGLGSMQAIASAVSDLQLRVEKMIESVNSIRQVPSNMRIIANRLEPVGGPVTAIAVSYGKMAVEMEEWVRALVSAEKNNFERIRRAVAEMRYYTAAASIQREIADTIKTDRRGRSYTNLAEEVRHLDKLAEKYSVAARETIDSMAYYSRGLVQDVVDMKRYVLSLSTTRTLCRIENARLDEQGNSLDAVISSLDGFQREIDSQLSAAAEANNRIQAKIRFLQRKAENDGAQLAA